MKNAAMDEFVERVRAESDILSVVASYVPLKRKGRERLQVYFAHRECELFRRHKNAGGEIEYPASAAGAF